MAVTNLEWTASADKAWITLEFKSQSGSVVNGTGSTDNLKIVIAEMTTIGDTDTTGTITITCTSCKPQATKTIKVSRCPLTTCQWEDTPYKIVYEAISDKVDACMTSYIVKPVYTLFYKPTIGGCEDKTETIRQDEITASFSVNTGNSSTLRTVCKTVKGTWNDNTFVEDGGTDYALAILNSDGETWSYKKMLPESIDSSLVEGLSVKVEQDAQKASCTCNCNYLQYSFNYTGMMPAGGTSGMKIGTLTKEECNGFELFVTDKNGNRVTTANATYIPQNNIIIFQCNRNDSCNTIEYVVNLTYTSDGQPCSTVKYSVTQDGANAPTITIVEETPQNCTTEDGTYVKFGVN